MSQIGDEFHYDSRMCPELHAAPGPLRIRKGRQMSKKHAINPESVTAAVLHSGNGEEKHVRKNPSGNGRRKKKGTAAAPAAEGEEATEPAAPKLRPATERLIAE